MKPILVTCYVNPDLDGVAGAIGYAEFLRKCGKDVVVGILGEIHDEAKFVLQRFNFQPPLAIANADDYEQVILVDASDLNGLEGKIAPEKVIEIIDHRKINEAEKFVNAQVQIELVGAAVTLVAEKFINNHVPVSVESATLLLSAIISNTLNFRGSVTTSRDVAAAEYLNNIVNLPQDFWRELFAAKSDLSGNKLAERIEGDFAWFVLGGKRVGIAQIEAMGAKNMAQERQGEIINTLNKLKTELDLDIIFQNTIDLELCNNYFVTNDEPAKKLLEKIFNVSFVDFIAERPNLIMRKQIVPLLKEAIEKG